MSNTIELTIPHNYRPRAYQLPILRAMDGGCNRAIGVWHRRSGKDKTFLNFTIGRMFERVGLYYYLFPEYNQGRKILWDGIDRNGFRYMHHFPGFENPKDVASVVASKNEVEMQVELKNGSIFQIIGTDKIDSIVGTNSIGNVFSEFALQNPRGWDLIRPILRENGGWAVFNYTPRGKNHGYDLLEMAKGNAEWFAEVLTVRDTRREDGTPVISEQDIDRDRREGMPEDLIQQEYYCSFNANIQGSYYGKLITEAEEAKRVTRVPYDPMLPVYTAWDLGVGDATAIWFFQATAWEFRFIDYYETSGEGLQFYAKKLQEKPYLYAKHIMPHDIEVRELGSGKSRYEIALSLGIRPIEKCPRDLDIEDGINAVRMVLPRCWFDSDNCKQGLSALKDYKKEYDDKRKEFKNRPYHDWTSHGADAFRYFATGYKPLVVQTDKMRRPQLGVV